MGYKQTAQHRFGKGSYHQIGLVRGQQPELMVIAAITPPRSPRSTLSARSHGLYDRCRSMLVGSTLRNRPLAIKLRRISVDVVCSAIFTSSGVSFAASTTIGFANPGRCAKPPSICNSTRIAFAVSLLTTCPSVAALLARGILIVDGLGFGLRAARGHVDRR